MKIRTKLICSYLAVAGVFILCGILVMSLSREVQSKTNVFANENWPAADLTMESRIAVADMVSDVLGSTDSVDSQSFISTARDQIQHFQEKFRASAHSQKDIDNAVSMLDAVSQSLATPLEYITLPGERMEIADSMAEPLLERAKSLDDPNLINTIWECVMAFNDILITGDPEERDAFDRHCATIEAHPQFSKLSNLYTPFKEAGEQVFTAAMKLSDAQDTLRGDYDALAADLENLEEFYEEQVVDPMSETITAHLGTLSFVSGSSIVMGTVLALVIGLFMAMRLVRPLSRMVVMLKDIAEGEGDLTRRLDDSAKDELGELAFWFNSFMEKIRGTITDMASNTSTLASASNSLVSTAKQLTMGAESTTNESASVAAAAEEMSVNMAQMSSSTEQMSDNVKSVAAAVEEMTASISEIARNAEQTSQAVGDAARLAEQSSGRIGKLGTAADEIGKVIEVIQDIAEQTNLLALNATIEAARAGDSGKGFAVVATEVKELARQTAEATEDIRTRIEAIQGATGESVQAINDITNAISSVNSVSQTIAAAVEEQSVTTKEIARSIAETSTAADTVATGIAQSASASQEITRSISGVDEGAKQAARNAESTRAAGEELSGLTARLRITVGQFCTDASQRTEMAVVNISSIVSEPIRQSFSRAQMNRVFDKFYTRFVNSDPRLASYFMRTDFTKQKSLLQDGIALALHFAAGDSAASTKVEQLGQSHSKDRMNILPELYPLWLNSWIETMAEVDPKWTSALETQWRSNLQPVIDAIKSKYETPTLAVAA